LKWAQTISVIHQTCTNGFYSGRTLNALPSQPKAFTNMNIPNPFESSDRSSKSSLNPFSSPIDWISEMKSDSGSKSDGGGFKLPIPDLNGDLPLPPLPGFNMELPLPEALSGDGIAGGTGVSLPPLQLFDGLLTGGASNARNYAGSESLRSPVYGDAPQNYWRSDAAGSAGLEAYGSAWSGSHEGSMLSGSITDSPTSSEARYSSDAQVDLRQVLRAMEPLLRSMEQLFVMIAKQFQIIESTAGGGGGPLAGSAWPGGKTWGDSSGAERGGQPITGWRHNASHESHDCDHSGRNGSAGDGRNGDGGSRSSGNDSNGSGDKSENRGGSSRDDIEQRRRDFEKEYNDRKSGTKQNEGGKTNPGDDRSKPATPAKGDDNSNYAGDNQSRGADADNPNKRYADTGIERGRTIFRDDFSGKLGEQPNRKVFDTEHIGADGKTRQRGKNIQEKGLIDVDNTVMDGKGNLQMFAKKEQTWDPVAKEFVPYTKGSYHTSDGLNFTLDDHPDGVAIEVRAKHPTADGAKFNALWIMTRDWTAKQGEKPGSTVEYDAAEGGGADIAIHWPYKDANGETQVKHPGGFHPKDVDFEDGQFHTYTVVITKNPETGRGDVTEYVDGKKEYSAKSIFPNDKPLHIKASMEVSPKWTGKTLTSDGGMNSDAAGVIDYVDVSELKKR
jgi:hypothetical protein